MTVVRVYTYRAIGRVNGKITYRMRFIATSFADAEATAEQWVVESPHIRDKVDWTILRTDTMNRNFASLGMNRHPRRDFVE